MNECWKFFRYAQISDTDKIINIFKNNDDVDEVYNLAAQSHVASSFNQPSLTWDITGKNVCEVQGVRSDDLASNWHMQFNESQVEQLAKGNLYFVPYLEHSMNP